ncbi:MAG TPA: hypothetical protein VHP30_11145 [Ignavibacteriales bacterium]|nr:hypothetical protein [Ignavibacteriales bacterium]
MILNKYDLPDKVLLENNQAYYRFITWVPSFLCIVLGHGNKAEDSLQIGNILKDNIPIYKRPTGGEAILLSPNMIVISLLKRGDAFRSPRFYFETYNESILNALRGLGVKELNTGGISDICIRDKKILGASIYRNKDFVFYHAVLNVSENGILMNHYLKHPQREPSYRGGRRHSEFVTSLTQEGNELNPEEIKQAIAARF